MGEHDVEQYVDETKAQAFMKALLEDGLVTHRGLLRMISNGSRSADDPTTVRQIMVENPITVCPSTSSLDAIEIMRTNRIGCLPVVESDQLVGIVTSYDFLEASAKLFKQHLANATEESSGLPRAQSA